MRRTLSVLISSTPEHCSWLQRCASSQKNERFLFFVTLALQRHK